MSDKRNENTDKKGTCVYEKDIHVSYKILYFPNQGPWRA
jgi:hypothetical protein